VHDARARLGAQEPKAGSQEPFHVRPVHRRRRVLPGFGLALGVTLSYVCLLVLIPLSGLVLKASTLGWPEFVAAVSGKRAVAPTRSACRRRWPPRASTPCSACSWRGCWSATGSRRRLVDACVDLPFALPTSVAGIALTAVYAPTGGSAVPLQTPGSRWRSRGSGWWSP